MCLPVIFCRTVKITQFCCVHFSSASVSTHTSASAQNCVVLHIRGLLPLALMVARCSGKAWLVTGNRSQTIWEHSVYESCHLQVAMYRWCLAVGLACGDQHRLMGSGSALEVVLHDYALYKSTFTLLYFIQCYWSTSSSAVAERPRATPCLRRPLLVIYLGTILHVVWLNQQWTMVNSTRSRANP